MAPVLRSQTVTPAPAEATVSAADRRQWWEGVQLGVSSMLTDAAHPAVTRRLAG